MDGVCFTDNIPKPQPSVYKTEPVKSGSVKLHVGSARTVVSFWQTVIVGPHGVKQDCIVPKLLVFKPATNKLSLSPDTEEKGGRLTVWS